MATYTRRGNKIYGQIRRKGVNENATFDRMADYRAWAEQREQEIDDGAAGKAPKKSLADAIARFKAEVCPTHRSGRMEAYRLDNMLAPKRGTAKLPGARQLSAFTAADLTAWKDQRLREVSPASVLREFTLLQSVFEHARRDWRWIQTNPARDVRKPAKPAGRKSVILDDERDRMLATLGYEEGQPPTTSSAEVAYMLLLSLETGMRAGELNGLHWQHVHLEQRYVHLPHTKNGSARDVPLSTRAVQLLQVLAAARRHQVVFGVKPGTRDALWRRARDKCKLSRTFHDARHTAATRIGRAGRLSVLEFCAMFGWRDPRMAMVYFNPTASDLAARLG